MPDTVRVGIIGAGMQAKTQLLAISEVLSGIKKVKVYDVRTGASSGYAEEMSARLGINVCTVETVREAAEADIVVTTTPSTSPVV